jgi:hypothetical protein
MSHANKNALATLRGMSEPFPFRFELTEDRNLVFHAVIFTSYEVHRTSKAEVDFRAIDKDPRCELFKEYFWDNHFEAEQARLISKVTRPLAELVKDLGDDAVALRKELEELKRKINNA